MSELDKLTFKWKKEHRRRFIEHLGPKKGYCPHFSMVMELGNCFFCHFKSQQTNQKEEKL